MITDIIRFNRVAKRDLSYNRDQLAAQTLGQYLDLHRFPTKMRNHYLLPMAAAIWSCPTQTMLDFPAESFLQFFENHGLLNINDRPQWQTVCDGSQRYIDAILAQESFDVRTDTPIARVLPDGQGVHLLDNHGQWHPFDQVIIAAHGDQALRMIDPSHQSDFAALSAFEYQKNLAYLHYDTALMPKRKTTWAAWNYLRQESQKEDRVAVTYWMNKLQSLHSPEPILVTLNPTQTPAPEKTLEMIEYEHPVFTQNAMQAQTQLASIQGQKGLWFAGAWTGYGFHEDGLKSAVAIARQFDIALPWETPNDAKQQRSA